jgi:small subunit ribosomal protein S9
MIATKAKITKEKSPAEVKKPKTKILAGEPVEDKPKPVKKASSKKEKPAIKTDSFSGTYIEALGRRKEAMARVRLFPKQTGIIVNGRSLDKYFTLDSLQAKITKPLKLTNVLNGYGISLLVKGGGLNGQADASALGISRALIIIDKANRTVLKAAGLLTRDSRAVERKKYGLRKARRATQWRKR